MDNLFVARQPIIDRNKGLVAYELLYRDSNTDYADFNDSHRATATVILNSFMEIGIDNLVGSVLSFINVNEDFILDEDLKSMFNKNMVLEILEEVHPSSEVVAGVKSLKNLGYQIALDDFQYSPDYDELLQLANFVKLDVLELGNEGILRELEFLEKYDVKLVAEKVEDISMYNFCNDLGFDYFQGYYFHKPELVSHKNIPANKLVVLNLLKQLCRIDFDFEEMEISLSQDAVLTYKLIRYVNSAAFSGRKEISSIRDALSLIGVNIIRKWVTLIIMMQLTEGKPHELLISALVRAQMCELLSEKTEIDSDIMFTVGLFSLLDALMDEPMIFLLDQLSLSSDIKSALLNYDGEIGVILKNVILYEQGEWIKLAEGGVDSNAYCSCYMSSVKWSDETIHSLLLNN